MTQRRESCKGDLCVKCCIWSSLLDLHLATSTVLPERLLDSILPFGSGQVQIQMAVGHADDSARGFAFARSWSTAFGGHTSGKRINYCYYASCRVV